MIGITQELHEASMMNFATITNCMWILIVDGTLMLDNAGLGRVLRIGTAGWWDGVLT